VGRVPRSRSLVFVNSVFPCLSETFVYDQFDALRADGVAFRIASLDRPAEEEVHPRMRAIQPEVLYLRDAPLAELFCAHVRAFARHPLRYLSCLARAPFSEEPLRNALVQLSGAIVLLHRLRDLPRPHLHVHFTYRAAGVALWAQRLAGVSYSLTLHGSDLSYDDPPDLDARLRGAEAIVSISRFNADYLREHFPHVRPRRLEIIPMGIPPLPEPELRPARGDVLRILHVGRLYEHKAQHHLIEACARLAARGVAFRCDLVGGGELRDELAASIAWHGLQNHVRLLGPRFHDEVLALYGTADLFVLCSITEGQPVVLMEAMRAGIPLIATAVAAVPELVQDGGILVPPADPEALADAIQAVADRRVDTAKLIERARSIVAEQYDLETNHRHFAAFLVSLCD
jgi:colanic acid/amylovoran biosynthesis glycosyltransferase